MSVSRYEAALELIDQAEDLVRKAEEAVEGASTYTERDVAETEAAECLKLLDRAHEAVAPTIERRRIELRDQMFEALQAADGDPSADWTLGHRKFHGPALKARLVERLGARAYATKFPW
jgi:hypothetical protein